MKVRNLKINSKKLKNQNYSLVKESLFDNIGLAFMTTSMYSVAVILMGSQLHAPLDVIKKGVICTIGVCAAGFSKLLFNDIKELRKTAYTENEKTKKLTK